MSENSFLQNLFNISEIGYLLLERPALQRQVVAVLLLLASSWIFSKLFIARHFRPNRRPHQDGTSRWRQYLRRLTSASKHIYFPIFGLLLGFLTIYAFQTNGWHFGLLVQTLNFFWLFFGYWLIVTLLHISLGEARAIAYHRQFLRPILLILFFVGLNRLLSGIISLSDQRLFTYSGVEVTLGALAMAVIAFLLFLSISWIIRDVLQHVVFPRTKTAPGVVNTILTISHYAFITVGVLFALNLLGINLSTLAIIGAGLSVGIGFGLQELVANFISGILLMFEQSIRPGDIVKVDDTFGKVEKLRIRAATIRTLDNIEIIVPNQSLLTSSVTTYTHSNTLVRIRMPIGASYQSDPAEVREALLNAAGRHGLVQKTPAPIVFFIGFGASSIDFELAIWITDMEMVHRICSDIYFIVWEEFKKRKIEIPYPQQDIHLRSGIPWESLTKRPIIEQIPVSELENMSHIN